uniref:UDP-N-acetylglucosamine transporter n=1 Tax=Parastrongyloides trichosuri TaxID=131310 RepID=A0A0N4ZEX7_PARTI
MHKITRFVHLFKNYIFDPTEKTVSSSKNCTIVHDSNLRKNIQKPKFSKIFLDKSKIYADKGIMAENRKEINESYVSQEKLGGDLTKVDLNSKSNVENVTHSMSLNYSSDSNKDGNFNKSSKQTEYTLISQKPSDVEGSSVIKKKSFVKSLLSIKTLSLIIFVFMGTFSVCSLRYVRFRTVNTMYIASVGLVLGEIFKLLLSVCFLTYELKSIKKAFDAIYLGIVSQWKETLNTAIPAFLYAIQNLLFQYAISYLDATVLLVTQQLKILTTALFAVTLLKSKLSGLQWISMVVLIIGIILIQWRIPEAKENNLKYFNETLLTTEFAPVEKYYPLPNPLNIPPQIIGLVMVFIGTVLSGFSGIFLEKIFKKTSHSIWCLNFQLALFSVPILLCVSLITDYQQIHKKGIFAGFDIWVVIVYFIYGLHGMIVALLLKHASSILKCFASGFVIAVTAIVSVFLFGIMLNWYFIIGAIIILVAVFMYSNFPYQKKERSVILETNHNISKS